MRAIAALVLAACAGEPAPLPVAVTVLPQVLQLEAGAQMRCTALVQGSDDGSVAWTASRGTIDADGLFTAPAEPGKVTIGASAYADWRATASVEITVSRLGISPAQLVLQAGGGQVSFTAAIDGEPADVFWTFTPQVGALYPPSGAATTYTPPQAFAGDLPITVVATRSVRPGCGSFYATATLLLTTAAPK